MKTAVYDQSLATAAFARARRDPRTVTAEDLEQIAIVDPDLADEVRRKGAVMRDGRDPATGTVLRLDNAVELEFARDGVGATTRIAATDTTSTSPLASLFRTVSTLVDRVKSSQTKSSARLDALEQRIRALEQGGLPRYCGIHEPRRMYAAGSLTTRNGGLWLATDATDETPGTGATSWRLVVKEGHAR